MGHQNWACVCLRELLKSKHEIVGVVAETDKFDEQEKEPYERLRKFDFYESLKDLVLQSNLKLFQPENINDPKFVETINSLKPDLLISVSCHSIIKDPLLSLYENKIINLHNAPLPRYRGRAPVNWAIINNEDHTAVTVNFIDKGVDTGKIIAQEKVPINLEDTTIEVLKKCLPLYPKLMMDTIKKIEDGSIKSYHQNEEEAIYLPQRDAIDGLINWENSTPDIYNLIRAVTHPYPGAFTFHKDKKLYIWKAIIPNDKINLKAPAGLVFGKSKEGIKVKTGDNYIILQKVQAEDGDEQESLFYFKRLGIMLGYDLHKEFQKFKEQLKGGQNG